MESQLSTANKIQFLQAPALAGSRPITASVGPGYYLDRWSPGNTGSCWHSSAHPPPPPPPPHTHTPARPQIYVGFAVDPNFMIMIFIDFYFKEKKERKKATHYMIKKKKKKKKKKRHLVFSHSHSSVLRSTGAVGNLSFFLSLFLFSRRRFINQFGLVVTDASTNSMMISWVC